MKFTTVIYLGMFTHCVKGCRVDGVGRGGVEFTTVAATLDLVRSACCICKVIALLFGRVQFALRVAADLPACLQLVHHTHTHTVHSLGLWGFLFSFKRLNTIVHYAIHFDLFVKTCEDDPTVWLWLDLVWTIACGIWRNSQLTEEFTLFLIFNFFVTLVQEYIMYIYVHICLGHFV